MTRKRKRSLIFWMLAFPCLIGSALILGSNLWIFGSTHSRIYASASEIDSAPVGIVLGTSKNVAAGRPNLHFENRLRAAQQLYTAGKVEQLLVSGHRDSRYYDETRDMIAKLHELGVPVSVIVADDRGARTLDSIRRAKDVFGLERVVIVSDDFHVGRALFLADYFGLDAVALKSETVGLGGIRRVHLREYFARVKAIIDLYLWPPGFAHEDGSP